jgi:hypothetical protein
VLFYLLIDWNVSEKFGLVASEKNISTAKKRDIAPFKVNGQSHIILQQLSCETRGKVSFVSNPAQISLKHSANLIKTR